MTAKRFNSYCDNENIRIRIDDDIKNKEVFHIYFVELDDALYCKSKLNPILDCMNELHEENEQLQHDASILIQANQDYRKENEELKQQLTDCEKFRHTVFQQINQEMMKQ